MPYKDKEKQLEYFKSRYKINKEEMSTKQKIHYINNRERILKQNKLHYSKNKEKYSARQAAHNYKIPIELVFKLRNQHNCDICSIEISGKTHHIDHCHKTGKIRGVLCNNCNGLLGMVEKIIDKGINPMNIFTYLNTAEVISG